MENAGLYHGPENQLILTPAMELPDKPLYPFDASKIMVFNWKKMKIAPVSPPLPFPTLN